MGLWEQKLLSPIIHMAQMAWEEVGYRYKLHSAQTWCLHLNSYRETGLFFQLFSKAPSGMWCKQQHKNYCERKQGMAPGLNSTRKKSLNVWQLRDPPLEPTAPEFPHQINSQFWHSLWLPLLLSSLQTIMAVLLLLLTAMPCLSVLSLWLYHLDYS